MYLIDTSIFSYLFRNDPIAGQYAEALAEDAPMFLSVQTVGELVDGATRKDWGEARKQKLMNFVHTFGVLPISEETTTYYGEVMAGARKLGRRLDVADAWIVATAKQYRLALVTHDADMGVAKELGISIICQR